MSLLLLGRSDTLPDQVSGLLDAPKRYRSRAQRQSVAPKLDQALLVAANPVGKQTELYVVDDCLSVELVPPAIGDVGFLGLRFLLFGCAQEIVGGELGALRTHDGYEHVSVVVVHYVAGGILTERVADLAVGDTPVLPGYESPCANERIRCHHLSLAQCGRARFARTMMPPTDGGRELPTILHAAL
jgi:hypothetical protein